MCQHQSAIWITTSICLLTLTRILHGGIGSSQFGMSVVSCKFMTSNGILRSCLAQMHLGSGDVEPCGSQDGFSVNLAREEYCSEELLPIILACAVWGPLWTHKQVQVQCDNSAVVEVLRTRTSKCWDIKHLLRRLHFFVVQYDIILKATHLPGVLSNAADAISHNPTGPFSGRPRSTHPAGQNSPRITGSIGVKATRLDIGQLERTAKQLCEASLASSSSKTYKAAQKVFKESCTACGREALPASEQLLIFFVADLSSRVCYSTAWTFLQYYQGREYIFHIFCIIYGLILHFKCDVHEVYSFDTSSRYGWSYGTHRAIFLQISAKNTRESKNQLGRNLVNPVLVKCMEAGIWWKQYWLWSWSLKLLSSLEIFVKIAILVLGTFLPKNAS